MEYYQFFGCLAIIHNFLKVSLLKIRFTEVRLYVYVFNINAPKVKQTHKSYPYTLKKILLTMLMQIYLRVDTTNRSKVASWTSSFSVRLFRLLATSLGTNRPWNLLIKRISSCAVCYLRNLIKNYDSFYGYKIPVFIGLFQTISRGKHTIFLE